MNHYQYLIVGGGMTADAAVRGIREVDPDGSVGMITSEDHPPYDRPPLSKALWKGKPVESIWRDTESLGVAIHQGRRAERLEPGQKQVLDHVGELYTYDRLLIATGGKPRRLPFGRGQIVYFRTIDDYLRLRQMVGQGSRFAVIGGGFIGSEIAAALATAGSQVTMLFPEAGIGGLQFPRDLSGYLNTYYEERGVEVLSARLADGLEPRGNGVALALQGGDELVVDAVVAGIGIEPEIGIAEETGMEVRDGIVVDHTLRTSHPDIYAAGDVAAFRNSSLGRRLRVEHEDNANTMGQAAGWSIAGREVAYDHLPFFYSDLFDLGYEAVGDLNPTLKVVSDWEDPYLKGVVYYLQAGRVRGVLLWNVWGKVDSARALIADPGPFRPDDLKGRLSS